MLPPGSSLALRLLSFGVRPEDPAALATQKRILTGCSLVITFAGVAWGLLYAAFDRPGAGAWPGGYAVLTGTNLLAYRLRRGYETFRFFQLLLILVIPLMLMLSLGGFVDGSAVVIWSLLCPVGATLFEERRRVLAWVFAFFLVLLAAGIWEQLYAAPPTLPPLFRNVMFVMNLGAVSAILFASQEYFLRSARDFQTLLVEERERAEVARSDAERASAAKSEFLATMSHELRTPLNGVVGIGHLLSRTELSPAQQDYMRQAMLAASSLTRVINDLLDYSKIESGHLEIEHLPFRVADLIEQVRVVTGPAIEDKALALRIDAEGLPRQLVGDAQRIGQALLNLMSNAARFTEQGEVELGLRLHEDADGVWLRAWVRDTGIGISAEDQARLFQPFTQVDGSISRRFGGTGLGLSITQRLVRAMGGEVRVESAEGQGARFSFQVRVELPPSQPAPEEGSESSSAAVQPRLRLAGLRVLVAEDHPVNQMIVRELLEDEGATVVLVDDGEAAVAAVTADPEGFGLVLMDSEMPRMDGLEATRRIRALGFARPVIALTAHAMDEQRQRCRDAGMDGHLSKPIEPELLVSTLLARTVAVNA